MIHQQELACAIARAHFGEDAGAVNRELLQHPGISEAALAERTKLTRLRVRAALRLLILHGAAEVCERKKSTVVLYEARTEPLLMRTRLALYHGLTERQFGELGRVVVHALFVRGPLTAHGLHVCALDQTLRELEMDEDAGLSVLSDMARTGLIVRCGSRRSESDSGIKRQREDFETENRDGAIEVGRGDNRRLAAAPSRNNDDDLWRICYWYLNRCFRNEACRLVVAERLPDKLAHDVLITGLNLALSRENVVTPSDDVETSEIKTDDVKHALLESNITVNDREFWRAIKSLIELDPPCVVGIPAEAPQTLRFVPGRLIAEVRMETIEEMIKHRYGKSGRRVFRALAIEGALEDKMIADKCMLDPKTVREKLFALQRDKLVDVQEVPRSHDSQRAVNWFYLWRVQPQQVCERFLEILYKSQLNVLLRLEALEHSKKPEDDVSIKLRERQRALLAVSAMRIDQSVMVMRDFGLFTNRFFPAKYTIMDSLSRSFHND